MLPGDRLVVAFIDTPKVGDQFKEWPLHVTIVPWFRLTDSSIQIASDLSGALAGFKTFEASIDQETWFGASEKREVHLVEKPTPFTGIENCVRNYFHKKQAWLVDETTKRHHKFRPHVTVQKSDKLHVGDSFNVDRLFVVVQAGTFKEVVAEIRLE